jgi:hypothetical protein
MTSLQLTGDKWKEYFRKCYKEEGNNATSYDADAVDQLGILILTDIVHGSSFGLVKE